LDREGHRIVEAVSQPLLNENGDPSGWQNGQIIVEEGVLPMPADTAPGEYHPDWLLYPGASGDGRRARVRATR